VTRGSASRDYLLRIFHLVPRGLSSTGCDADARRRSRRQRPSSLPLDDCHAQRADDLKAVDDLARVPLARSAGVISPGDLTDRAFT
jgi:hypothetical protein